MCMPILKRLKFHSCKNQKCIKIRQYEKKQQAGTEIVGFRILITLAHAFAMASKTIILTGASRGKLVPQTGRKGSCQSCQIDDPPDR